MQKFLGGFLGIIVLYHIIVTVMGYGILGGESQIVISIIRDLLWLIFVLIVMISNLKSLKDYFVKWKKVRIRFVVLIVFSIGVSILVGQSISSMMIGIKYGFFYLFIFLAASIVGHVGIKKINIKHIYWSQYFLMTIVILGFIRQILKIIKPEMFMNIGYGKFDDFYFGANPPIYYLTGFEGTTRWQGLFAGPNNYGYFLVAFLPLIFLWRGQGLQKIKNIIKTPLNNINILFMGLWILAIGLTLSRAAILGTILIVVLLAKDWIKKNKKISIGFGIAALLGIVGLSFLKYESTIGHINAKILYFGEIINNPLGHGLGTSGPAIHHEGNMLPENYFMQIMLDIGTVGFIIWAITIFHILLIFKNIKNTDLGKDKHNKLIYVHWKRLYIGWSTLLLIGLFLHVFEDSMVNYIFFIFFGIVSGYLSKFYDFKNNSIKEIFFNKQQTI